MEKMIFLSANEQVLQLEQQRNNILFKQLGDIYK